MKKLWGFRFLASPIIFLILSAPLIVAIGTLEARIAYKHYLYLRNITALRDNIYHEARGESISGQYMVAYVTVERAREDKSYWGGSSVYDVVYYDCQFEWTCRDDLGPAEEGPQLELAEKIAKSVWHGQFRPPMPLARARYYLNPFASWLNPEDRCWFALNLVQVGVVGSHYFYAEPEEGEVFPVGFDCMPLPRPKPAPEPTSEPAAQTP